MSQLSDASTILYEEVAYLNEEFVFELDQVAQHFPYFDSSLICAETEINSNVNIDDEDCNDDDDDGDEDDYFVNNNEYTNDEQNVDSVNPSGETVDKETLKQETFCKQSCGCKSLHNGKPCTDVLIWDDLINYRLSCLERSKEELELIIKVQIFHHRRVGIKTNKNKERSKPRQEYYFAGLRVCRELFAFAHGLHRQTVDSIAGSLEASAFEPRAHGNKGRFPSNTITLDETKAVKTFINNYAIQYGMPLPGRLANYRQDKAKLLPSDKTKNDIYGLYCEASSKTDNRTVSLSSFKKIWCEQCPNVVMMRPATDLCLKCQKYVRQISNSGSMSEEDKETLTQQYSEHVHKVKSQRDNYRRLCKQSEKAFSQIPPELKRRGQGSCSQDVTIHYSFDYAQQVFYPHYAQQVGPMYFKTPRKCQCFGVACEASGTQVFYLIDEAFASIGKGANSVTSLLHDHFHHSYGEANVELHMDNCSGQNKNNTVIGYGMWRVMNGVHQELQFNPMEAGHTKFAPDWHFGLWKVCWKRSDAESVDDIARSVEASSKKHLNVPRIVDEGVPFYNWTAYCKKNFKPVPHMKTYHHFRMSKTAPGTVFVRQYADYEEIEVNILKKTSDVVGTFPEQITPVGLDAQRQWYLFEEVAPLCHNSEIACPRPEVQKPKKIKIE